MANEPLISIIMPNFNGAKYLNKSIESFLLQDYPNKELIIVDNKSVDASHEIIQRYCSNNKEIIWIRETDKGISDAFNIGIDKSKGEIIGYLGSDDLLYKNVLDEIAYAHSWCNFDAIYFDSYSYYINDKKCVLRKCPKIEFTKENLLGYGTIVGWEDIFFKRYIYDSYRYDVNNKYGMDYEFYLRVSSEKYLYLYMDKVATVNMMDNNISMDFDGKQFDEACVVAARYTQGYDGPVYFTKKTFQKNNFQSLMKKTRQRLNKLTNWMRK